MSGIIKRTIEFILSQIEQLTSDVESERTRIETLEHSSREAAKLVVAKEAEVEKLGAELKHAIESNSR